MLHRQQLLIDRQNRSAIAVRKLQVEAVDIHILPRTSHRGVLAMKIHRIDAIRAVQDATLILPREQRDQRPDVGHSRDVVPDVRHVSQLIDRLADRPIRKAAGTMSQNPLDVRIPVSCELPQIVQIELVRTAMKPGKVHCDPQSQFIRQFQLFMRQKLVNPALRNVSCDGEQPVWFKSNEALFAHIALDVLHATRRCHQAIHPRLRVLPDLLDAPAIVSRHVYARRRGAQHQKMRFATRIQPRRPLLQRRQIRKTPSAESRRH